MQNFLRDQVCLVTGGAQGIGWAVCQALADHGAKVYVCDISLGNIAQAQAILEGLPWCDRIVFAQVDVACRAEVEAWIAGVFGETGRIDVLVNNAAFIRWEDHNGMSVEDDELTMRVGYNGMVYGIKAVLPLMKAAGRGHIVNMGSSAGKIYVRGSSASYAAVKAAIDAYSQTLQLELKRSPIGVTLVRLSVVAGTDFFREHVPAARIPRMGDFLPYLTPPQVAMGIVRSVYKRRDILNMPQYLPLLYWFFMLAPNLFRWLTGLGNGGKRDYGEVQWRYRSKQADY